MKTNLLIGNRNDCGFDGNSSWLAGTILLIRHRGLDRLSKTSRQLASGVMLAAAFAAAQAQGQFYDFEGAVGPEWSHQKVDITPVGNRRFLGQFGNDTVSLTLNGLPAHQEVTVSFDLFIIRTWDGNWGDIWELRMRNGPTLLHTTFSNNETGVDPQAFPKDYPGGANAPQTGAVETNTLGYVWAGDRDAVYHLTFTVPHTDETLGIAFAGSDLEDISNESWGLDNVRVELTPDKGVPYVYTSLGSKGTWSPTNNLPVSGVSIFCTCALVRLGDAGVCLLATTNPAVPVALGSWSTFLPISDAVLVGNLAYIASWEADFLSTVEIVDFTDPAKPVLKGYYDTPGYAKEVALRGNLAYVADAEGGLLILDVGDPAWPRRLGGYDTKGSVQHVEVYGNYAYIRDGNWLITLDVSDPANPRRVGIYEVVGGISALKAVGTKLYVSEGTGDLRILDVSNPASIQLLGTYRGWGGGAQAVALSGRFLYLAKGTAGLHILDVTDPAKPVYLTGSWASPAEDVALIGNYALVAGGDRGLLVYEVQQNLYPPLQPPVIAGGMMTLTWPYLDGARLQMATNLATPLWQDIPGSEGTNTVSLPTTEGAAFFRLVKGPKPIPPPPGMVAWWAGDGDARDLMGRNHGTLMNGAAFVEGMVGRAFVFDGRSQYVEVSNSPSLGLANALTIEAWINLDALPSEPATGAFVIMKMPDAEAPGDWGLTVTPVGLLRPHVNVGGQWVFFDCRSTLSPGVWYHLAMTYDGSNLQGYINGSSDGTAVAQGVVRASDNLVRIGSGAPVHGVISKGFFPGIIDEVSVFNRALTAAEIKAIYDAGSAGKIKPVR